MAIAQATNFLFFRMIVLLARLQGWLLSPYLPNHAKCPAFPSSRIVRPRLPAARSFGLKTRFLSVINKRRRDKAEHNPCGAVDRPRSAKGAVIFSQKVIMCISEPKSDGPVTRRKGHEQPVATSVCGWRYHHIGIPTDVQRPDEIYLERFKMYVSAFETSPCGIQWMRF